MAQVQLSRADAQGGQLPRLCMQCGEPATETVERKYSTDKADLMPPPPEPVGCLIVMPIVLLAKFVSWSTSKSMVVRTPLCQKHAHGWFRRNTLDAAAITDESIIISGVSEPFAQAWESRRPVEAPLNLHGDRAPDRAHREIVKVRCRSCQALNDEKAKFCNQCSAAM